METFKINDYVKIKVRAFEEEPLIGYPEDFQGQITEIEEWEDDIIYTVKFDAQSLDKLPEEYIIDALDEGESYLEYNLSSEDIIKTERRDTDKLYQKALNSVEVIVNESIDEMNEDYNEEEFNYEVIEGFFEKFIQTNYFKKLPEEYQKVSNSIILNFTEMLFYYFETEIKDVNSNKLRELCLTFVPEKVNAEKIFFEAYGQVLIQFFSYLKKQRIIKNADKLIANLNKISKQIYINSQDEKRWGIGKAIAMGATEKGIDLEDDDAMQEFINQFKK